MGVQSTAHHVWMCICMTIARDARSLRGEKRREDVGVVERQSHHSKAADVPVHDETFHLRPAMALNISILTTYMSVLSCLVFLLRRLSNPPPRPAEGTAPLYIKWTHRIRHCFLPPSSPGSLCCYSHKGSLRVFCRGFAASSVVRMGPPRMLWTDKIPIHSPITCSRAAAHSRQRAGPFLRLSFTRVCSLVWPL